jgi:hypothetical protein
MNMDLQIVQIEALELLSRWVYWETNFEDSKAAYAHGRRVQEQFELQRLFLLHGHSGVAAVLVSTHSDRNRVGVPCYPPASTATNMDVKTTSICRMNRQMHRIFFFSH